MISGAYTSSGKTGRLFFKRTAFFFWEDSEWSAGYLPAPLKIRLLLFEDLQ